jgi:hypothetical protein
MSPRERSAARSASAARAVRFWRFTLEGSCCLTVRFPSTSVTEQPEMGSCSRRLINGFVFALSTLVILADLLQATRSLGAKQVVERIGKETFQALRTFTPIEKGRKFSEHVNEVASGPRPSAPISERQTGSQYSPFPRAWTKSGSFFTLFCNDSR